MAEETKAGGQSTTGNAVIMIGALLVFALVLGGFGIAKYRVGAASVDWPTAGGHVTTARLDTTRSNDKTKYQPSVTYAYEVAGTRHNGHRISALSAYTSRGRAETVLARYKVGTAVDVHYDPEDPSSSVLEPGAGLGVMFILAAAVGCLMLAVLVLVSALRRGAKN